MDAILFGAPLSCFSTHLNTYQLLDLMTFTEVPFELNARVGNHSFLNALCHLSAYWMSRRHTDPSEAKLRALFLSKTAALASSFLAHSKRNEHKEFAADALRLAVLLQTRHACEPTADVISLAIELSRQEYNMCNTVAQALTAFVERLIEGEGALYGAFSSNFEPLCAMLPSAAPALAPLLCTALECIIYQDSPAVFLSHHTRLTQAIQDIISSRCSSAQLLVPRLRQSVEAKLLALFVSAPVATSLQSSQDNSSATAASDPAGQEEMPRTGSTSSGGDKRQRTSRSNQKELGLAPVVKPAEQNISTAATPRHAGAANKDCQWQVDSLQAGRSQSTSSAASTMYAMEMQSAGGWAVPSSSIWSASSLSTADAMSQYAGSEFVPEMDDIRELPEYYLGDLQEVPL